ncbi:hypothetical protein BH20ACI2_BH20ACI2_09510 [soil metagenome]
MKKLFLPFFFALMVPNSFDCYGQEVRVPDSIKELKKVRAITEPIAVGDMAPDFTLADVKGQKWTLSRMGHPTVLVFYRGWW